MSTPADFPAAVVAALQANSACATAFGSTGNNNKFFGVYAMRTAASPNTTPGNQGAIQLPYARVLEVGGNETWNSGAPASQVLYYERGILQIDVFATSESQARSLGKLVAAALNDGNLTFADGGLLECRLTSQRFIPEPDSGVGGVAAVYHRVLEFLYVIEYSMPPTGN